MRDFMIVVAFVALSGLILAGVAVPSMNAARRNLVPENRWSVAKYHGASADMEPFQLTGKNAPSPFKQAKYGPKGYRFTVTNTSGWVRDVSFINPVPIGDVAVGQKLMLRFWARGTTNDRVVIKFRGWKKYMTVSRKWKSYSLPLRAKKPKGPLAFFLGSGGGTVDLADIRLQRVLKPGA